MTLSTHLRLVPRLAINGAITPPSCPQGGYRELTLIMAGRVQLKSDGTWWHTGGVVKVKLANGVGRQYSLHYLGTWCIQHYYRWCAHLGCQQSNELTPPADLNGHAHFAERRNLVSAHVPSHFKRSLPTAVGGEWCDPVKLDRYCPRQTRTALTLTAWLWPIRTLFAEKTYSPPQKHKFLSLYLSLSSGRCLLPVQFVPFFFLSASQPIVGLNLQPFSGL